MSRVPHIRRKSALTSAAVTTCFRAGFAFFFSAICLTGVSQVRAQSTDSQSSQDVAEAARQERTRKQQTDNDHHVYTNEDLHRSKILTPKDQSRASTAKRKSQPLTPSPNADPLDANSLAPQEPLGDVARRYRNAKKISPFHLPSQQPELAAPKLLAPIPELKPGIVIQPQPPARNFELVKPSSPISRASSPVVPLLPSARAHRIDPFVGRGAQPMPPYVSAVRPVEPHSLSQPSPSSLNRLASPRTTPLPSASIVVQSGDTLWAISLKHLGRGTRWLELMAANPNLPDPTRLSPGTILTLPAKTSAHRRPTQTQTITIQSGDTLSKIALATYGRASTWPCLAHANPTLANPHLLVIGQSLTLPASCIP